MAANLPDNSRDLELEIPGSEADCSYLPQQRSKMVYRLAYSLSETRYESLLSRGWRRFGRTLFRPNCSVCRACQSLRISIPDFLPSKSQRRTRNQNQDIEVTVTSPSVTREHLSLYNRYHEDMHIRRQWPLKKITRAEYYDSFLDGEYSFSREFQYRHHGKLVGLGLVDMTPSAMSSIYFIHDPEYRQAALGTWSVMCEIAEGQRTGRQWLYMGYYIQDCPSMNYKNRFTPHQFLQQYVADHETPDWQYAEQDRATD